MDKRHLIWPFLGAACYPHVDLEAPTPGAPLRDRFAAYEALRPIAEGETITRTYHRNGGTTTQIHDYLVLGDGRTVHHAEDLLPVVPVDSPTATAAKTVRSSESSSTWWYVAGGASAVGGLGALVYFHDETGGALATTGMLTGAILLVVGYVVGKDAQDAQISAFATYEASLRRQLSLCVDGVAVVDCAEVDREAP